MRHIVAERIGGETDARYRGLTELRRDRDDYAIKAWLAPINAFQYLTDYLVRLAGFPPGLRVLSERLEACSALPSL